MRAGGQRAPDAWVPPPTQGRREPRGVTARSLDAWVPSLLWEGSRVWL